MYTSKRLYHIMPFRAYVHHVTFIKLRYHIALTEARVELFTLGQRDDKRSIYTPTVKFGRVKPRQSDEIPFGE